MADFEFGKLDFSTSFNPTSAFPIDARCLFSSLSAAETAAASAEMAGSKNTKYYIGQKLLVVTEDTAKWYKITPQNTLEEEGSGGGVSFKVDETLSLENGVLSVNTAQEPDPDNTLPITSAAVANTVGNIEVIKCFK